MTSDEQHYACMRLNYVRLVLFAGRAFQGGEPFPFVGLGVSVRSYVWFRRARSSGMNFLEILDTAEQSRKPFASLATSCPSVRDGLECVPTITRERRILR